MLAAHGDASRSLRYRDFADITVPAGRTIMRGAFPEIADRPVRDFEDHSGPVIGCPVTLLAGTLQNLWYEQIDMIEQARLWDNV